MICCSYYIVHAYHFPRVCLPGYMATNMSGIGKTSFMAPGPHKYVWDALATIGIQSKTFGTISHALKVSDVMLCD